MAFQISKEKINSVDGSILYIVAFIFLKYNLDLKTNNLIRKEQWFSRPFFLCGMYGFNVIRVIRFEDHLQKQVN